MSEKNNVIIIGISGASASGKTLFAETIYNELSSEHVAIISEDSYYKSLAHLSLEERTKFNFDHPDSFEYDLLYEHLQLLKSEIPVKVPIYDFKNHTRTGKTKKIGKNRILIIEGILIFSDSCLRSMMDIRVFIDTSPDVCLLRRVRRDHDERGRSIFSILDQYEKTVRPMYLQFIEPSKKYADIIVPRGGENRIAIDMIKAKIKELICCEVNKE